MQRMSTSFASLPRQAGALRVQRGASMLEALVALMVLALGVLGLARLQIATLMEARNADARSMAVQAASDLLDRMQVNRAARFTHNAFSDYLIGWEMPPAAQVNCLTTPCSSDALAEFDIWQWKQSLALQLPNGDATVFRSSSDPTQLGILLAWSAIQQKNQAAADAASALLYAAADAVVDARGTVGTGESAVNCPAQRICHLVYLRP
jgi:type IV pilus assembly protein PilV